MRDFVYNANPGRVIFGSGTFDRLADEVARLGLSRVLVLSTPPQEATAREAAEKLGASCAGVFPHATMHTPTAVTEAAIEQVRATGADGVVSVGGGSTIGLGKAIALRTDLPQIVLPTTYAGSEMTPIIGETQDGEKKTQTTPKVLPEVVIYDVGLTLSLPPGLSGVSGVNAIAHAVEALYARERNPIISMFAKEGVAAFARALPAIIADPGDRTARSEALYGAWLCGACLGSVGMSLHHKLCHTLGGTFNLPHAETHTIVLPHALAYNAPAVPEAVADLAQALGRADPCQALYDLGRTVGAPASLRELGMPESGIDEATERALANPYWNPRPLEKAALRACIAAAWAGDPPRIT